MKRPPKNLRMPRRGLIQMAQEDRLRAAEAASYAGSPEHKLPGARNDASLCPSELESAQAFLTQWLQESIRNGRTGGPMEGRFPRYVWCQNEDRWFAARLTNQTLGQYKGYPIEVEEVPPELRRDQHFNA